MKRLILGALVMIVMQASAEAGSCENKYNYSAPILSFGTSGWYEVKEADKSVEDCINSAKSNLGKTVPAQTTVGSMHGISFEFGDYTVGTAKFRYKTDDGYEVSGTIKK